MTVYKLLLFVHIASIATWTGGAFMFNLLGSRAAKQGPPPKEIALRNIETAEWMGPHFYVPLMVLTLASGIGLVLKSGMGFEHFFVVFGLGMIIWSGILGGAFFARKAKVLKAHVTEHGVDATAFGILKQLSIMTRVQIGLLLLTIYVMTIKPFS